jgi:glucose uptake protein
VGFCVITMLGWGSWANTQKLAGKDEWRFPLYYWDYALGIFLLSIVFMFTLGALGSSGMPALQNLHQAQPSSIRQAVLSGALFNVANILLVVAIDIAGMSVAFPVGIGLALIIGTIASYLQSPKGNPVLLFAGVGAIMLAMIFSGLAYSRVSRSAAGWIKGVLFAVIAGCLMGYFYPELSRSVSPDFINGAIEPGFLTPYTALFLFSLGVVASNVVVNTIFLRVSRLSYGTYLGGTFRLHSLGILGGFIWMVALTTNVLASGVAGPAISYALGQGATLVAAIWGVIIWKEFRNAPGGTMFYVVLMFLGYTSGLCLIGAATL